MLFIWKLLIFSLIFSSTSASIAQNSNILTKNASIALFQSQNPQNSDNKYCQICCIEVQANTLGKKCGSHTLCKYSLSLNKEIGPACKGFIRVGFTQAEKRLMVDAHNTIRNKVASGHVEEGNPGPQPTASNMRTVEWDEELSNIAERWAAQCIYSNDICRDLEKFPVGQNIGRGILATDGELTLVNNWFQERNYFDRNLVESYVLPGNRDKNYARYSQLVWADTYLIGCARAIFQTNKGSKVIYTEHLICNYGPTGNIPKQRVYRVGPACSECHEGTACNSEYEALCAADLTDEFNDYLATEKMDTINIAMDLSKFPEILLITVALIIKSKCTF